MKISLKFINTTELSIPAKIVSSPSTSLAKSCEGNGGMAIIIFNINHFFKIIQLYRNLSHNLTNNEYIN